MAGGFALVVLPAVAQAQPRPQVLPSCNTPGQVVSLTLNTGTALPGPPPGRLDPLWRIQPTVDVFSTTRGPWFIPPAGSRWVQRSQAGNPVPAGAGLFIYFIRFLTPKPPATYQSITINGVFGADNNARMSFNGPTVTTCTNCFGTPIPIPPIPVAQFSATPNFGFLGQFLNRLEVEVTNLGGPSGLLVSAVVSAVC